MFKFLSLFSALMVTFLSVRGTPRIDVYDSIEAKAAKHYVPKITFATDVSAASVKVAIELIDAANDGGAETIVIEFDTPGGSVMAGQRLAKAIERSKAPVVCVVDGMAASMGFYLLQSCDTRVMTKRSILMAHEPAISTQVSGKEYAYEEIAEVLRKINRAMAEHIAGRLGMSVEAFMARIANTEWWMNWDEALKVNAVDFVILNIDEVLVPLRKELKLPSAS